MAARVVVATLRDLSYIAANLLTKVFAMPHVIYPLAKPQKYVVISVIETEGLVLKKDMKALVEKALGAMFNTFRVRSVDKD